MADFRGFLCWTPETAAATINTEAVSPSRAVFLATHAPLRIRRAGLDGRAIVSDGPLIDENTVLKDFLSLQSDTGALLLPIVGDSGTGKSHLVRWVRENLPPSDKYKVIYLEKAKTSLRAVIDALLADADSGALAQLRADIHRFTDGVDSATLSRRLVNALSESLAATTARDVPQHARPLAGPRGLTVVLQDPHVSAFMLGQGKFIPRLAEQLLQDRMDGEPDRPMAFTMDDLPTDLLDLHRAAQVTIKLINVISGNTQLQQAAVDLLNQHLEAAVKRVASLGAGRLQDAMLQVRREYARKGKEIILLIEDFALIQGVQKDLLDAVIEPPTATAAPPWPRSAPSWRSPRATSATSRRPHSPVSGPPLATSTTSTSPSPGTTAVNPRSPRSSDGISTPPGSGGTPWRTRAGSRCAIPVRPATWSPDAMSSSE